MKKELKKLNRRPQTSTTGGFAGIGTQILAIFQDVQLENLLSHICSFTVLEAWIAFGPIFLWVWMIFHDEDAAAKHIRDNMENVDNAKSRKDKD